MQHQYWVTKRTVLSKLGSKEDECVVASDAELDAKLELFRSISDSCILLQRVIDQYQERMCVLAQEENSLGRFLKDAGKGGSGAGKLMAATGKGISYSGQQRMNMRSPLLRLYHEVETFRGRAVSDTRMTINAMERARTEYRAALSWMKAASAQLDPDTGRGVHKFRKAQAQVRESKQLFDKLTLDCLQKVDLLAAARCNMFSHALVNYQNSLLTFTSKTSQALITTANGLASPQPYDFSILKELSQNPPENEQGETSKQDISDQMLFFQDEFKDIEQKSDCEKCDTQKQASKSNVQNDLLNMTNEPTEGPNQIIDLSDTSNDVTNINSDLAGLSLSDCDSFGQYDFFLPSQLLRDTTFDKSTSVLHENLKEEKKESKTLANLLNLGKASNSSKDNGPSKKQDVERKDMSAWYKLFAELDPLANPDAMPGANANQSHAA